MKKYLDFLQRSGCEQATHSDRNLMTHLIGTYNILESWGRPKYICIAGLFHSIYGTNAFRWNSMAYNNRHAIANLIGPKAELLAFLFSIFTLEDLASVKIGRSHVTITKDEMDIDITRFQYSNLIEISVSNFLEQAPFISGVSNGKVSTLDRLIEKNSSIISSKSYTSFKDFLSKTNYSNTEPGAFKQVQEALMP